MKEINYSLDKIHLHQAVEFVINELFRSRLRGIDAMAMKSAIRLIGTLEGELR